MWWMFFISHCFLCPSTCHPHTHQSFSATPSLQTVTIGRGRSANCGQGLKIAKPICWISGPFSLYTWTTEQETEWVKRELCWLALHSCQSCTVEKCEWIDKVSLKFACKNRKIGRWENQIPCSSFPGLEGDADWNWAKVKISETPHTFIMQWCHSFFPSRVYI